MGLRAVCVLTGQILGFIYFNQEAVDKPTTITGALSGLVEGLHGFHVHALGDITDGCKSTGTHYNPRNMVHGAPNASERHAGDLGNVVADSKGMVNISIEDAQVQLFGEFSVLGRAIVVHEKVDDLGLGGNEESKKTGNAGARLGCCIIGIANPEGEMAKLLSPTPSKARQLISGSSLVLPAIIIGLVASLIWN